MLPAPDPIRLAVPPAPEPPAAPSFPWVATVAPVAMALVLFAATRTPYTLMFAALGPLVAVGAAVDGRRSRRRSARQAAARDAEQLRCLTERAHDIQHAEHERLLALAAASDSGAVLLGSGRVASAVVVDDDPLDLSGERCGMLRAAAADPPAGPVVADAADGIGICGSPVLAVAVARSIAAQLDGVTRDEQGFRWNGVRIAWAAAERLLPADCGVVVDLDSGEVRGPGVLPQRGGFTAYALTAAAGEARITGGGVPDRVELASLLDAATADGLRAPIGRDARGPVEVDLLADGPHALVAGTTGSGKSELLVSWILALAATRSPAQLSFLLVDFKGGAAFAPLAGLPHVTGILSDLDPRLTRRAIESLRAEVLRRERLLAESGARSIADLPPGRLARLVIVVDEFAALVAAGPDLHDVFADLAARGRSLGLHLILCTQRPAGVIRDAVLANIGLRICLRVTDRGDAIAMTGVTSPAGLAPEPRGRAVLQRDGEVRILQVAMSGPGDAARIPVDGPGIPERPWLDPLPHVILLSEVPSAGEPGHAFGVLDLPAEQRQPAAVYDPPRHGHVLVTGTAGSGATTALAALSAGADALVLSPEPADAWAQLDLAATRDLLVIDGLDALLAAAGPDLGHELGERIAALLRGRAPAVMASVRRIGGPVAGLAGLFGSRLLLRQSSRDEHLLAGGQAESWDPSLPPGAGTWRGDVVQVADPGIPLPPPELPPLPRVAPGGDAALAVVAARPGELALPPHVLVVAVGREAAPELRAGPGGRPTVLVGDPEAWQSEWALLTEVRRSVPIVLIGCTASDHRMLLREVQPPPPLGPAAGECWLSRGGHTVRASWQGAATPESEENSPPNR